jgi:recombination protein RecA
MSQSNKNQDKQRIKELEDTFLAIERQFGKGSIMKLDSEQNVQIETISSGSFLLDLALGIKGLPKGRITEIYGSEASGKTTIALHAISECQKQGGVAAFIDAEHALDVNYARRIGVKTKELLVAQPDYGEQALEVADALVKSDKVDLIVIDSVAALVPKAELEGEMGDSHVGLHARLMSQALRKLTGSIARSKCILLFINQTRTKIGVMYGNPEVTTGGQALKFYSSVRIEVRRGSPLKGADNQLVGHRLRLKVVKNKLSPPFQECEVDVLYGTGINHEGEVLDIGVQKNVIERSGAWYSYKGEKLGQGRENARDFFRDNPKVVSAIKKEIESLLEAQAISKSSREKVSASVQG